MCGRNGLVITALILLGTMGMAPQLGCHTIDFMSTARYLPFVRMGMTAYGEIAVTIHVYLASIASSIGLFPLPSLLKLGNERFCC